MISTIKASNFWKNVILHGYFSIVILPSHYSVVTITCNLLFSPIRLYRNYLYILLHANQPWLVSLDYFLMIIIQLKQITKLYRFVKHIKILFLFRNTVICQGIWSEHRYLQYDLIHVENVMKTICFGFQLIQMISKHSGINIVLTNLNEMMKISCFERSVNALDIHVCTTSKNKPKSNQNNFDMFRNIRKFYNLLVRARNVHRVHWTASWVLVHSTHC